jgi:dynein heavy chain
VQHLCANSTDNIGVICRLIAWSSYCYLYLLLRYHPLLDELETEIVSDYNQSLCRAILEFILLDPGERKRLNIYNFPADYPPIVIQAPVPWHSTFVISSHVLHHRLFIVNPVLLSLRDLWQFQ